MNCMECKNAQWDHESGNCFCLKIEMMVPKELVNVTYEKIAYVYMFLDAMLAAAAEE